MVWILFDSSIYLLLKKGEISIQETIAIIVSAPIIAETPETVKASVGEKMVIATKTIPKSS